MSQLHFPDEIPVSEEEVQVWLGTIPNIFPRGRGIVYLDPLAADAMR